MEKIQISPKLAIEANEASFSVKLCSAPDKVIQALGAWEITEEEYREWVEEHDQDEHTMWENGWDFTYEEAKEVRAKFLAVKQKLDKIFKQN